MPKERFAKIPDRIIKAATCKALKSSLWLLVYLYRHSDWTKKTLFRKDLTISKELGIGQKTVARWRQQLKKAGLIDFKFTGRYHVYSLTGQISEPTQDSYVHNESTNQSTLNINTPSNENPSIYTDEDISLSKKIAEWGVNRARNPSYKTEEEYVELVLPYIKRLGRSEVFQLWELEKDNRRFWNNLKEVDDFGGGDEEEV